MATYFNDCSSLEGWSEAGWWGGSDFHIEPGVIAGDGNGVTELLCFNSITSDLPAKLILIVMKQAGNHFMIKMLRITNHKATPARKP